MRSDKERPFDLNGEPPMSLTTVIREVPPGTLEDPFYLRMIGSAGTMNNARYGVRGLGWSEADQANARRAYHVRAAPETFDRLLAQTNVARARFAFAEPWLVPGTMVATADLPGAPLPCLERIPPLLRPWMLDTGKMDSLEGAAMPDTMCEPWKKQALVEPQSVQNLAWRLQPNNNFRLMLGETNESGVTVELFNTPNVGPLTVLTTNSLKVSFTVVPMPHVNLLELPVLLWRVSEPAPEQGHGFWDEMLGSIQLMNNEADLRTTYNGELRFIRHYQSHVNKPHQNLFEWQLVASFHVCARRDGSRLFLVTDGEDALTSIRRVTTNTTHQLHRMYPDLHNPLDAEANQYESDRRQTWQDETSQAVSDLEALHQQLALGYTAQDNALDWLKPDLLTNPPTHLVDLLLRQ